MERLDPQHIVQYRLYRGETYYKDGKHLRDLSKLNRDLSKVVMVTTDPGVVSLQSENGVIVRTLTSYNPWSPFKILCDRPPLFDPARSTEQNASDSMRPNPTCRSDVPSFQKGMASEADKAM